MAKFTINAQEKISVWQEVTYEVEAKNLKEAMKEIKASPKSFATDTGEMFYDTEEVLEIDFYNGNTDKNKKVDYTKE